MKRLIKRDEILWNNNPIARILIYLPAKIISSNLAFPLIILSLPAALLGKQSEIRWYESSLKFNIPFHSAFGISSETRFCHQY